MNKLFRWFGLPGRLVLTTLMSLFACAMAVCSPSLPRIIAAMAMVLSSLGDITLMDYKPITRSLPFRGFIPGSIVFTIAHILYITAFGYNIYISGYKYLNIGVVAAFACYVLMIVMTMIMVLVRNVEIKSMFFLSMIYLFVISTNCATVYSYAYSARGMAIISAVGVFSFLISDYFIVMDKVCDIKSKVLRELIWWFYPVGQILLILGV